MRFPLIAMLAFGLPSVLPSQGTIVSGPCPIPPPCRDGRCVEPPVRPCRSGNAVVRVSSTVRADLVGRVVRYEVSEVFVNRGAGLGEADYLFPLPAGAAFEDLRLTINGELVAGETMNATQARRVYEEIVRRRRDPGLVEWMGSGLLRARIFPLNPGEEKRVVVRFQSVAAREGDALRIDYVRGTPSSPLQPRPVRLATGKGEADADTFILTVGDPGTYGTPYSPTHSLAVRDRNGRRTIEASGTSREVTILLPLRRAGSATLSVLTHRPDRDSSGYALITVTPPAASARTLPRDVTFVVDVSGSMRGEKLAQAKAAGDRLLATLHPGDRFRLIDFSTDVREFRDGWTPATSAELRSARAYLDALDADGSTNISGALEAALDVDAAHGRLPLTVFVTDGEPTVGERNPDAIAALVARRRGEARVFTVGVGAGVNAALIEQLALEGHGTAHFVRADESVERAVALLASRLSTPVLTGVRVIADGVRLRQVQPSLPADVFAGQDLVLLTRYDGSGRAHLTVEGHALTGTVRWTSTATFAAHERSNAFIPRLWAAQRLGWLAAERRRHGGNPELDAEIKSLGERYGIPTEFSSYLVLEPGATSVASGVNHAAAMPVGLKAAGAAAAAKPATPEGRFEAARQAAARRDTRSLAQLDSVAIAMPSLRIVGSRRFALRAGRWTDVACTPAMRVVRVKAYSPAYFALATGLDGLQDVLTLGDDLLACGRTVAIAVGRDGIEQLADRELAELRRSW